VVGDGRLTVFKLVHVGELEAKATHSLLESARNLGEPNNTNRRRVDQHLAWHGCNEASNISCADRRLWVLVMVIIAGVPRFVDVDLRARRGGAGDAVRQSGLVSLHRPTLTSADSR